MARVISREPGAFEEFVTLYRPTIYGVLRRQMGMRVEDADEVFQRFLVHVWQDGFRRLRRWEGIRPLPAYLASIVRNLARDYWRERMTEVFGLDADRIAADTTSDPGSAAYSIDEALDLLPRRDSELIRLHHYEGQSYREIAHALGLTVNHVGVALTRARKKLRSILEPDLDD